MKTSKLITLSSSILLAYSVNASAVTIDLFDVNQAKLTDLTASGSLDFANPANSESSSVSGPISSILGGNRDLGVNLVTNPLSNSASIQVAGGYMSYNVGSGATGQGIVQWDGNDGDGNLGLNTTGLGGIDLTEGGTLNAFGIQTIFSDFNFLFTITAYDMLGNWTAVTLASSDVPLSLPDGVLSLIGFDTFENCGPFPEPGVVNVQCSATPVDLSNLGALQAVIDPTAGFLALDLTLNSIKTVPEPSILGLLGIGLAGFGAASRRKAIKA